MKNLLFLTICVLASGFVFSQAKTASAKNVLPKGAIISGQKITLKKGFSFQRVSENEVNVVNNSTGLISGSFQCGCHTDTGGGTCTVQTLEDTITCVAVSCNNCGMRTTIDPPKPDPLDVPGGKNSKPLPRKWVAVNFN